MLCLYRFIYKINYININVYKQIFSKYILYVCVFIYTLYTQYNIFFILNAINHLTALLLLVFFLFLYRINAFFNSVLIILAF